VEQDFCLASIVNEYSCDVPFVNVRCDDHGICVWEWYEFDVGLSESERYVRPFGSGYWAFDHHKIDLVIILSSPPCFRNLDWSLR
jgi:hypothetical protein